MLISPKLNTVGLSGLGVMCSPRDPRFVGSNPTEVGRFFSGRKNPEHKVLREGLNAGGPESEISGLSKNLKPEKIGI